METNDFNDFGELEPHQKNNNSYDREIISLKIVILKLFLKILAPKVLSFEQLMF